MIELVEFRFGQRTGGDDEPVQVGVLAVGHPLHCAQDPLPGGDVSDFVKAVDQHQPAHAPLRWNRKELCGELVHKPVRGQLRARSGGQGLIERHTAQCCGRDQHRYGGATTAGQPLLDKAGEVGAQQAGLAASWSAEDQGYLTAGQGLFGGYRHLGIALAPQDGLLAQVDTFE
ncbi:hypothetical protein ACJWDR_00465 [Streptomyces tauricus]|uniref:hypothetical protein n=1 Tax=Streptomyces tauricus TaxID=68274 RepID=UPI00387F06DF